MNTKSSRETIEDLIANLPEKIGLFDSGIGGVSILNEFLQLPIKNFVYVADTAHLPYGSKSVDFLIERAVTITQYLEQAHGITTIVIACHTSASTTLNYLQKEFPHITFIDPLPWTTYYALVTTKTNHIGVFATERSITTGMHKKLLVGQNLSNKDLVITEQSCPLFVDLIENNGTQKELESAVQLYTSLLQDTELDTLILGCTHYPFIGNTIQQALPNIRLVSAASCISDSIANDMPDLLGKHPKQENFIDFKISGDVEKARILLEKYLLKKSVSNFAIAQLETLYR